MIKKIIIFLLSVCFFKIYALSIGDFTLKYEKNNKYFNFYDNPSILFNILEKENKLGEIETGYSEKYKFEDCYFSVLSREFGKGNIVFLPGVLQELVEQFGITDANHYYAINYLEVFKNFSTIRGVSIGDDIQDVLQKYPEAVLYKNNGKYKWDISDCYWEKKINTNKLSDIGYVLLETANWQYNRAFEVNVPMHYELVFVIKDKKVKSIIMQYIVDAM